ncbi:uncharacterized protein Z519_08435 [Cladophialophora bantiana CBS 173.52]|uniref:Luciferase domain-containing protein n=1 Tax=Cladophialophora bantiana (strain ATCC 10958 / CBS 173.52 / CDC B-1940 / NIH 8579) TaxID=1442370 RepID=A0A0D2FVT2_CLAB1|nr:uncharacterized protein Z519_08435 [Cladophialophora bantiana CBS 173.52]KIW90652.1 hypothetical protein Z519_08435 [Cladophialophora bantiana CBS 173.52]
MDSVASTLAAQYHKAIDTLNARPRQAAVTTTAVALTLSLAWVLNDFHAWKSFGTGGTPPTWAGYWRMTKIRLNRMLLFGKDDLCDPSPLSSSGPKYLDPAAIPRREGPRPAIMARTMPQRQVPYKAGTADAGVEERVRTMMASLAAKHPSILDLRPSKTEGGSTDAIYAKPALETLNDKARDNKLLGTEIAHAHPSDGSLHVWLSEADAKTVVEKGWGMRFPLKFIDRGWAMVYAPRTMAEADVVERIVQAGIAWVSGVEV